MLREYFAWIVLFHCLQSVGNFKIIIYSYTWRICDYIAVTVKCVLLHCRPPHVVCFHTFITCVHLTLQGQDASCIKQNDISCGQNYEVIRITVTHHKNSIIKRIAIRKAGTLKLHNTNMTNNKSIFTLTIDWPDKTY